jgi:CheY-like chemotaxis protein
MDGKQTLAEIKKDGQLSDLPIVVFSTSNNPVDEMYCAHYGVELVTKPSNMRNMQHEVKRLLQPCMEG